MFLPTHRNEHLGETKLQRFHGMWIQSKIAGCRLAARNKMQIKNASTNHPARSDSGLFTTKRIDEPEPERRTRESEFKGSRSEHPVRVIEPMPDPTHRS